MLASYFWNMDLAEALFPSLHAVEVGLRNTINSTLTDRYHTQEWWHEPYALTDNQRADVMKIEQKHYQQFGSKITSSRIVTTLNFAFWTTILSHPYESRIWRYKRFVLVDQAFPQRSGTSLHDIHQRFNNVRLLRNRVMHHERIYDRPHLLDEHTNIHQALSWICPELHRGIHVVDDFIDVHQHGWERVYIKLHGMLGGP